VAARSRFYVDTNVVIAIIELPNALSAAQSSFIEEVDRGRNKAITSELTLAECLVKPMADRNADVIAAYLTFLDGRSELPVLPVSRAILLEAARLRAETGVKLPDAIHLATAYAANCDVFLTSDRRVRVPANNIRVWFWDELGIHS
jgi:predicted nucleic acid-binding protein